MNTSLKLSKKLSFGEEIANSVTHAVGAVIMLILLPISSTYSSLHILIKYWCKRASSVNSG